MKEKKLKKGKKKGKKIIIWLIVIALIVLGIWACGGQGTAAVNMVETVTLETGSIEEFVSVKGMVESEETKTYFAPATGKLASVEVTMGDVVKAAEAAGIRDKVKIMVGGAPVTQTFCDQIGADVYTSDAASAADAAAALCK